MNFTVVKKSKRGVLRRTLSFASLVLRLLIDQQQQNNFSVEILWINTVKAINNGRWTKSE